jgi:NADPH:quinone reductase-like Zn-dependent oxidoreductase
MHEASENLRTNNGANALESETVIVSGASSGIGASIVSRLRRPGRRVFATMRRPERRRVRRSHVATTVFFVTDRYDRTDNSVPLGASHSHPWPGLGRFRSRGIRDESARGYVRRPR